MFRQSAEEFSIKNHLHPPTGIGASIYRKHASVEKEISDFLDECLRCRLPILPEGNQDYRFLDTSVPASQSPSQI
ncbi:hypothetical protein JTE90_021195 [Oedothorax gibbosus]|uniref:Uncharacterized protein n=1 Tax=Oedothorax gibbosus TaxID=931172 RepID=A0AAV6V6V3_9ARAC|nr:hypothetical protein JTE90_021195 [Oedothorax gibbosus]